MTTEIKPQGVDVRFEASRGLLRSALLDGWSLLGLDGSGMANLTLPRIQGYFIKYHEIVLGQKPSGYMGNYEYQRKLDYSEFTDIAEYKHGEPLIVIWNKPPLVASSGSFWEGTRFKPTTIWAAVTGTQTKLHKSDGTLVKYVHVADIDNQETGAITVSFPLIFEPNTSFIYAQSKVILRL